MSEVDIEDSEAIADGFVFAPWNRLEACSKKHLFKETQAGSHNHNHNHIKI
ncbi:MAG: hypothetical protein F6K54_26455 [Okeania sp. SIO3B5]|nr:hypothetical protein [Okeania sp. SIO3B5]